MNEQTSARNVGSAGAVGDDTESRTEKVKEKASHLMADARDRGGDLVEEGKDKAHELGERAGEMARTRASQEKERIATGIRTFADVLRRGSDDLSPDRSQYRPILTSAADRVEEVSDYLNSRDVDDLTQDVRRFARDHTPLFLGGAFVLGFAGARFLKSSGDAVRRESEARTSGRGLGDRTGFADHQSRDDGLSQDDRYSRVLPEGERFENRGSPGAHNDATGRRP